MKRIILLPLQDGEALPDGPVVISPDGLFPSLYREGKIFFVTGSGHTSIGLQHDRIKFSFLCQRFGIGKEIIYNIKFSLHSFKEFLKHYIISMFLLTYSKIRNLDIFSNLIIVIARFSIDISVALILFLL